MRTSVDDLVQQVLEIDNTPIAQATFSAAQIAQYLDFEMHNTIVPTVKKCNEEYFINTLSVVVGPDTPYVPIPSYAAGFALRDIYLYDTGTGSTTIGKINRINPDQIPYISGANTMFGGIFPTGMSQQYYFENNNIVFWPRLTNQFVCHVRYFKSPNHLMSPATVGGQITGKLASNMLQLDNVPSTWTTFTGVNRLQVDITTPTSPYNFRMYPDANPNPSSVVIGIPGIPIIAANVISVQPGFIVEVDADTWAAAQAGDFMWTTETCGFVQSLPFEAYELIKMRASMRILKAQGDLQNLNISAQMYNALQDDFVALITPKVQNMPEKIWNSSRLISSRGAGNRFPRF